MDRNPILKQIEIRAKRRAMKELDIIMAYVVDTYLDNMTPDQLTQFKYLLDADDVLIYKWLMQREPLPVAYNNDVWQMLLTYSPNFPTLK